MLYKIQIVINYSKIKSYYSLEAYYSIKLNSELIF